MAVVVRARRAVLRPVKDTPFRSLSFQEKTSISANNVLRILQLVPTLQIPDRYREIIAAQLGDLSMNDSHSPPTDVLDDDGAPHGAAARRRHTRVPAVASGKEHEPYAPMQAPTPDVSQ
jgi:hypothetical protein